MAGTNAFGQSFVPEVDMSSVYNKLSEMEHKLQSLPAEKPSSKSPTCNFCSVKILTYMCLVVSKLSDLWHGISEPSLGPDPDFKKTF